MNVEWSIKIGDLAIVIATLVAPFAAIQAQKYLERWHDKEKQRAWVFRTLMATRALSLSAEHIHALNAVPVDFNRDKSVIEAWRQYFNHLGLQAADTQAWGLRRSELLIELLYTMSKSLGYQFEKSQIASEAYIPKAQLDLDTEQQIIRQGLAEIFRGKRAFPMNVEAFTGDPEIELRRAKMQVLRKIVGNRYAFETTEVEAARAHLYEGLNEAMVVFSGSPKVIGAIIALNSAMRAEKNNMADEMTTMFKAMCEDPDLKIDVSHFNDSYFLNPIGPKQKRKTAQN